jgi:ABC-type transporter Mla MlaB component
MALGHQAALAVVMLRTSILYLRDRVRVVLSGQLVGEGARCLSRAIVQCFSTQDTVEIDLDGITCVDRAGEEALLSLLQAHGRFLGTSPFARALCERLGIPIEGDCR